jgi:hypothetical protein
MIIRRSTTRRRRAASWGKGAGVWFEALRVDGHGAFCSKRDRALVLKQCTALWNAVVELARSVGSAPFASSLSTTELWPLATAHISGVVLFPTCVAPRVYR